jgi:hypothetical protein
LTTVHHIVEFGLDAPRLSFVAMLDTIDLFLCCPSFSTTDR